MLRFRLHGDIHLTFSIFCDKMRIDTRTHDLMKHEVNVQLYIQLLEVLFHVTVGYCCCNFIERNEIICAVTIFLFILPSPSRKSSCFWSVRTKCSNFEPVRTVNKAKADEVEGISLLTSPPFLQRLQVIYQKKIFLNCLIFSRSEIFYWLNGAVPYKITNKV